ncbi:hypothetical protein GVAV_003198 [Gurleya vavrai]
MDLCGEGVDISQAVHIIQETKLPKFTISDDYDAETRKKHFEDKLCDNEKYVSRIECFGRKRIFAWCKILEHKFRIPRH